MSDEVHRVYSTLLTRVHRKPRTASTDELPVLIGAMDLPVYKRDKASGPMVVCNGGLHVHAVLLMPPASRLKGSLTDHFREKRDLYAGSGRSIQRIDVRPVVSDHGPLVDYVLKTVLNGRDAAISKQEDTVRELESRYETLIKKLSNPTEEMMLAGALAHNAGLRPMRAAISAGEAKKIFLAMIAVVKESIV